MVYVAGEQATAAAPRRGGEAGAELDRLGDEIAELAAHVHAATYQLLVRLRVFDERGGWGGGFYSCAHWLSWRTGIGTGTAREHVRVARALGELPQLSEAMRRGRLSFSKIRALTRIATPANEKQLLELARQGTASHIEKVVRAWRRVDRLEEQRQECERHRGRKLTLYQDDDGMYVLRGRLDPEVGALLDRVLAAASEVLYGRRRTAAAGAVGRGDAGAAGFEDESAVATAGQRRADAIGLIAECALRQDLAAGVRAADNEGVAAAKGVGVTEDALANNEATEAHEDGGETRLDNLVMLCRRHHRAVHEEGFRVRLTESGEIEFLRPDGQPLPAVATAPELPDDPVASLAAVHRASGLEIDSSIAMSWWMGERLDLDFALLTLRGP